MRTRMVSIACAAVGLWAASPVAQAGLDECRVRGGLPNFFASLEAGREVRIGYLGGSITDAEGWRVLSRKWFAEQYPKAKVTEIRATICGTGAELGACRLGRDVLHENPDLLFVEFAVNGAGGNDKRIVESMEGIVRQTWRHNPKTDICSVYTCGTWQLNDLKADKPPYPTGVMEKVAEHYGVPSIHLALEVARQVKAGTLVFQGAKSHDGDKIVFSGDGVHPFLDTGHPLYLAAIVRSAPALKAAGAPGPHALPTPLEAGNWEKACLVPLEEIGRSEGWAKVAAPGDVWGAQVAAKYLPAVWKAGAPGQALTFRFKGTALGLAGLRGPDAGQFTVTVDELAPVTGTFFDHYAAEGQYRVQPWIYPAALADGEHRVSIVLSKDPPDKVAILKKHNRAMKDPAAFRENNLYVGGVLLVEETVH